jgi:hypothetical protein
MCTALGKSPALKAKKKKKPTCVQEVWKSSESFSASCHLVSEERRGNIWKRQ